MEAGKTYRAYSALNGTEFEFTIKTIGMQKLSGFEGIGKIANNDFARFYGDYMSGWYVISVEGLIYLISA